MRKRKNPNKIKKIRNKIRKRKRKKKRKKKIEAHVISLKTGQSKKIGNLVRKNQKNDV